MNGTTLRIAATALLGQIMLVTYNCKDYDRTGVKLFDTSEWDLRSSEAAG